MTDHNGTPPLTYRDSGVDINAADRLIRRIAPLAAATRRPGADGALGGFGGLLDLRATGYRDPILVAATDGVGTKLRLAIDSGQVDGIGIDLVAMCVNDLLVQGAEPLIFLDYFATGHLEPAIAERVVAGIAAGCQEAGCALVGGETAEMPGFYAGGDFDLAGFALGAVERDHLLGSGSNGGSGSNQMAAGDLLLGLESDGLHANGFSLVRHILERTGVNPAAPPPFDYPAQPGDTGTGWGDASLTDLLLAPTRIYVRPILNLLHGPPGHGIKGLCHITGGGFYENLPRILPAKHSLCCHVQPDSWPTPPLFRWLATAGGVAWREMYRTFNCGIGMVMIVAPEAAPTLTRRLQESGERPHIIGKLAPRVRGNDACVIMAGLD